MISLARASRYITLSWMIFFLLFVMKVRHGVMERALRLGSVQNSCYGPVVTLALALWAPCAYTSFNKTRKFGCCELSGPLHV